MLNHLFPNKETDVAWIIVEKLFHTISLSTNFSQHHYFISTFHVLNVDVESGIVTSRGLKPNEQLGHKKELSLACVLKGRLNG